MTGLNWDQALSAVGGDRSLLAEVLQAFLEEVPVLRQRMVSGVSVGDWLAVAKATHTLQASLRLFEGQPLELAQALESSCKRGTSDESRDRFAKFAACLENVVGEVEAYLRGT